MLSRCLITWDHMKYGLDATGHLPRDFLRRPVDLMQEAWGEHFNAKVSINAMIDLWTESTDDYTYENLLSGVRRAHGIILL